MVRPVGISGKVSCYLSLKIRTVLISGEDTKPVQDKRKVVGYFGMVWAGLIFFATHDKIYCDSHFAWVSDICSDIKMADEISDSQQLKNIINMIRSFWMWLSRNQWKKCVRKLQSIKLAFWKEKTKFFFIPQSKLW